ncbi:MAG: TonB-dependent receptor [Acidobacteriota bacterium]
MKTTRVLGVICFLCAAAFAQAESYGLEGRVTDSHGNAVAGADVTAISETDPRYDQTTKTNADGKYAFSRIPGGDYSVTASHLSNGELKTSPPVRTTVRSSSDPTVLNLVIEGFTAIREIVTISADTEQPIEQVSKTVNIIGAEEMRDRADITLIDAVRTIPGFRIQQLGGFGRTASIKARGLRNQDTAVLIDGIRFRDPGSITGDATPFLSDFTLTSIEQIEVLRGSGSSLYGTNAIGGALNFQTPRPAQGFHGQVSGTAGGLGLGRFRTNLSYGTPDNKFGISGALSRTAYTEGIDGDDNASNTNFQSRIDYRPFYKTTLSGRFFVSDAKVRLNSSPDTLGMLPPPAGIIIDASEGFNFTPDVDDPDSIQKSRFFVGQFAASHIVNSKLTLSASYQGIATNRTNDDGPLGVGYQSAYTNSFGGSIHTANVQAVWTANASNTFKAGYEFENEHFYNEGSTPSGTSDFATGASQRSNTIYVQHLLSLLDGRLQFAGGARAQGFSLSRPQFSVTTGPYANFTLSHPPAAYTFDGSASYFISQSGTKLRTHVGNGYRVPSLYERFGTFFFSGFFFPQGNPALKPERSIGIDAGLEQYFARQRVKASATYFYTRIKDEITYLPTDDFGAPAYYNFDRHYSRGAELSIDIKATTSTNVFASYTFTNSDVRNFRRPTIATVANSDRRAFGIPDHQFTLVATQRIKRFWASVDLLATSAYLAPVFSSTTFGQYTYRFGGNRRADATAGYTFRIRKNRYGLRLFGTIENLFDNKYFENGFRTPGRNGRVGLEFSF